MLPVRMAAVDRDNLDVQAAAFWESALALVLIATRARIAILARGAMGVTATHVPPVLTRVPERRYAQLAPRDPIRHLGLPSAALAKYAIRTR